MGDLVFLRELIRTPGSECFPLITNRVFTHLGMEALRECVITRAAPPCNPIAVALALNLLGIESINACARAGKSVDTFNRWYTKRMNTLIHLNVGPETSSLFRGGIGRTYVLAGQTGTSLGVPDREHDPSRTTRPASLIRRDLHARRFDSSVETMTKRASKPTSGSTKSTKVKRTLRVGANHLSQSSSVTTGVGIATRQKHTEVEFFARNQVWFQRIFIIPTGGRTLHCYYSKQQAV